MLILNGSSQLTSFDSDTKSHMGGVEIVLNNENL